MNIKIRRVIMAFFIIFFAVTAPLLILYASGYRYDVKRGRLQRTGNIFIEAPSIRNARVYVNNDLFREPLTRKVFVKNLIPDEYRIRIEKDDRFTWEKQLSVQPGFTTFVKDVVLFLKSEPILRTQGDIRALTPAPNGSLIAYSETLDDLNEVYLFDATSGRASLLYRLSEEATPRLTWSARSKYLLIDGDATPVVVTPNENPLLLALPSGYTSYNFNTRRELVVLSTNTRVDLMNPETQAITTLYTATEDEDIVHVYGDSDNYYILTHTADNTLVKQYNANHNSFIVLETLPRSRNYEVLAVTTSHLLIKHTTNQKLFLTKRPQESLDPLYFQQFTVQLDAHSGQFSGDASKLLFYNDYELSYFDLNTRQTNLIDRFSNPIRRAVWYPDHQHVITLFDQSILSTDLNTNRATSQVTLAASEQQLYDIYLATKSRLFSIGSYDNTSGLYEHVID